MIIPKGKTVIFKQNGALLPGTENVDMILEDDITLSLNSTFADLIGSGAPRALSVLGSLSRDVAGMGFSGQVKQLGFQVWEKTDPLNISLTVGFHFQTNAYNDVVLPTRALAKLPLPDDGSGDNEGLGLIPPGPSILEAFGSDTSQTARGKRISCRIGFIFLPSVIIREAEPTFSAETDQNGWPIFSKVMLQISTIYTATTTLIDNLGYDRT